MTHKGSCHCGQIKFEAQGTIDTAMECNCSHCSRKGYLLWFVPRSQFELQSPESALSTYTFNKHVIQHHFCPKCGCAPFGPCFRRPACSGLAGSIFSFRRWWRCYICTTWCAQRLVRISFGGRNAIG